MKSSVIRNLALVVVLVIFATTQLAFAGDITRGVAPANSSPYGMPYSQWGAAWWRYVMSFPAATSPLVDATGANCGAGQSGPVFFLVGTAGGDAVRSECVIPAGKAILFPVINVACAIPEDGGTKDEVVNLCSREYFDFVDTAQATVDGVAIKNVLQNYRSSTWFSFTGAEGNLYDTYCTGVASGSCYVGYHEFGYTDGYWIMLFPLTPGKHVIHFSGGITSWGFVVNVTYNLTVQ